ncbi:PPOX class F420-dependent oxidoreductase [Euzebya tangerina]|uniref:PPOX class F420-dependent oxidoreductase n=1 Tax=Euzebya tangerina TaxID=591198 RepID=UPI000E31C0CA|nr:PPOX class F420-dependent oxidoreductase [Euzebya tangerina]
MDLQTAIAWAEDRKHAVLITLRQDGRAQSSDIYYVAQDGSMLISVTDSRAKTTNMRRDDRVVLHLTEPETWSYVSFDGTVELSPVTTDVGDDTNDRLVAYYRASAAKEHPNWDEYRQAMVDEGRLLVTFTPTSAVGQING